MQAARRRYYRPHQHNDCYWPVRGPLSVTAGTLRTDLGVFVTDFSHSQIPTVRSNEFTTGLRSNACEQHL